VRQVLRKLDVERIVVTMDAAGWTFEGCLNAGRLLGKTGPAAEAVNAS
jgi:hypothetical protein